MQKRPYLVGRARLLLFRMTGSWLLDEEGDAPKTMMMKTEDQIDDLIDFQSQSLFF